MSTIYLALLVFWWAGELAMGLLRRAGRAEAAGRDRGSMPLLFATNGLAVTAALLLGARRVLPTPLSGRHAIAVATLLLLAGIVLRGWSMAVLGRLFTMNVAIRTGHQLVERGPYRLARHPSYTGMLLAFLSLGIALASWASLIVIAVPITLATLYRIRVEERALADAFGEEYRAYARRTYRLVPFVY